MNSKLILTVVFLCCIAFGYFKRKNPTMVPWMGVLLYKPEMEEVEEATHIVMVGYEVVLANAKDIDAVNWYSLMKHGKCIFYTADKPWEVGLTGRLLHPEYQNGSLNTIAILFLHNGDEPHVWKPIKLIKGTDEVDRLSKIYSVGYSDHKKILKQEINAMEYVSQSTCKDFYVQEEIDMELLWPPNPICFRVMDANDTCVNDSGMALASNSTDEWLLMGLGTHGPGCSLPARYIEILPYVKWITDTIEIKKMTRRSTYISAIKNERWRKPFEDEDFLKTIKQHEGDTFGLKHHVSKSNANKTEVVEGCQYPDDKKTVIYMESQLIKTPTNYNIAVYKISIVDTNFAVRTCVTVYARCLARGKIVWGVEPKMDHYPETPMYGRVVPSRIFDVPQRGRVMLITDPRPILGRDTYYLHFEYAFKHEAYVEVYVYGKYNDTGGNLTHHD